MAREYSEIATHRLNLEAHVLDGLGTVNQCGDSIFASLGDYRLDRIDGSDRIGYVHDRHQFRFRPHHGKAGIEFEIAIVVNWSDPQSPAGSCGQELPRNDIGVMLHV